MNHVRKLSRLMIVFAFIATSCQVRLISGYDEITDKTVTTLQEKFSGYFVKMDRLAGTEAGNYAHFIDFFDEAKTTLRTLQIRAAAMDKNDITVQQLQLLESLTTQLEALHQKGFAKPEELSPLRQPFNSAFTAIIKLQMALKRGK